MEYRCLGKSGLEVSEVSLGCNNFGWHIDETASIELVNRALDLGINYFDTADSYGQQRSEEYLGKALKGKRSNAIIATKFGSRTGEGVNTSGGSRHYIIQAVEASLKRLETDYIDLYQIHSPDPKTPLEETIRALDELVRAGKIRYFGCCNFSGWQLAEAWWISQVKSLNQFITVQNEYNLLNREIEKELMPCCEAHGIGVIPWGPLAAGFLTGKYRREQQPPSETRLAKVQEIQTLLWNDANFEIINKFQDYAEVRGHTLAELAIAWVLSHPWISTVIAGATRSDQLLANAKAASWKISTIERAEIDLISIESQAEGMMAKRRRQMEKERLQRLINEN
jgi:aryl-alcohol dehydrogenase-like predicted oxidoreductase